MVVSTEEHCEQLKAALPSDLASVSVVDFPEGISDADLVERLPELSEALKELSPRPVERIVGEQVWRMLVGTWSGSKGDQGLADIINSAAEGPGGLVSPLLPPYSMPEDAKIALDKVPDFRFYVQKGFFGYDWRDGTMQGLADFHCHTEQFAAFVSQVIEEKPAEFFDFWRVFKAHI